MVKSIFTFALIGSLSFVSFCYSASMEDEFYAVLTPDEKSVADKAKKARRDFTASLNDSEKKTFESIMSKQAIFKKGKLCGSALGFIPSAPQASDVRSVDLSGSSAVSANPSQGVNPSVPMVPNPTQKTSGI